MHLFWRGQYVWGTFDGGDLSKLVLGLSGVAELLEHSSYVAQCRGNIRMLLPQHPGPYLQRLPNKPVLTANLRGLAAFSSTSSPLTSLFLSLSRARARALSLSLSLFLSLCLTKHTSKAKLN